jgi:low affinity Fe/Cu permease
MPTPDKGLFDRFASVVTKTVSRAPFFAFCVLLVVIWAPSIAAIGNVDTWQLIINTVTTIITFLLVALLQNSSARADTAVQHKLDAQSRALRDLMVHVMNPAEDVNFFDDIAALEEAVAIEAEVGTKKEQS